MNVARRGARRARNGRNAQVSRGEAGGTDWLGDMALIAPAVAQVMMLVVLLVNRQWMFAAMIGTGLISCLASLAVTRRNRRMAARQEKERRAEAERAYNAIAGTGAERDARQALAEVRWQGFAPPLLESLLGLDDDPLMWRTVARLWLAPGLEVPLGACAEGVFSLDLARQGPHALVAGTTGSGKSVLLQSWCLALAARNPPDRLNFVFLDFKGGSAFRPLEALPHTVGNVCDLDLKHATRALLALEQELTRREHLVAAAGGGSIDALDVPAPRLLVVIDEFHALRDQLPDYVDRLVRVASLGRSLNMHVIACTQNPMGQVSADMKANMSLSLCLRVRDGMQSVELLGGPWAASISPSLPGAAYANDGERVTPWRCAAPADIAAMIRAIDTARRFHGFEAAPTLFTAPLPTRVRSAECTEPDASAESSPAILEFPVAPVFGLADDGTRLASARMPLGRGNIGVFGPHGRGKTTLLRLLERRLAGVPGLEVRISRRRGSARHMRRLHAPPASPLPRDMPPRRPHTVWLVDDADECLDPFATGETHDTLFAALADPEVTVVLAMETMRHVRVPEQCPHRLVLPTGDKANDQMNGVPARLWSTLGREDFESPGRGVWLSGNNATLVQCACDEA